MKIIFTIIAGLIITLCNSFALDSLSYNLKFLDGAGEEKNLLIGIHKDATETIDYALGEDKLPDVTPPDGIYAVLYITDSTTMERFWSYHDFRPIPQEDVFVKYYKFRVYNLQAPYTIQWTKIGSYVDSAFIQDVFTGNIVKINMKLQEGIYLENYAQDQFNVVVYYNKNLIGVDDGSRTLSGSSIEINPNPVSDETKITFSKELVSYKIINLSGIEIMKTIIKSPVNTIYLNDYPTGLYFLIAENKRGDVFIEKLIKY